MSHPWRFRDPESIKGRITSSSNLCGQILDDMNYVENIFTGSQNWSIIKLAPCSMTYLIPSSKCYPVWEYDLDEQSLVYC